MSYPIISKEILTASQNPRIQAKLLSKQTLLFKYLTRTVQDGSRLCVYSVCQLLINLTSTRRNPVQKEFQDRCCSTMLPRVFEKLDIPGNIEDTKLYLKLAYCVNGHTVVQKLAQHCIFMYSAKHTPVILMILSKCKLDSYLFQNIVAQICSKYLNTDLLLDHAVIFFLAKQLAYHNIETKTHFEQILNFGLAQLPRFEQFGSSNARFVNEILTMLIHLSQPSKVQEYFLLSLDRRIDATVLLCLRYPTVITMNMPVYQKLLTYISHSKCSVSLLAACYFVVNNGYSKVLKSQWVKFLSLLSTKFRLIPACVIIWNYIIIQKKLEIPPQVLVRNTTFFNFSSPC